MDSSKSTLQTLRKLPPRHFEQFVADIWQERQGWQTKVSDSGADGGIDILGQPSQGGKLTAVQCKRYAAHNRISSDQVQQYAALRQQHSEIGGVTIVTTAEFTQPALDTAAQLDVRCIDGGDLAKIVDRHSAHDILQWYAAGKPKSKQ